jgi:hypothetical protein
MELPEVPSAPPSQIAPPQMPLAAPPSAPADGQSQGP